MIVNANGHHMQHSRTVINEPITEPTTEPANRRRFYGVHHDMADVERGQ